MSPHSNLQPIRVYGKGGPNPPKVEIILNELGIPHEFDPITRNEVKSPAYLAVNPNGRLPAIHDPNGDLTLWESGAILEYIVGKYDKDQKLSFPPGSNEAFLAKQWSVVLPDHRPGPLLRPGILEMNRVTGVLEVHLTKQKQLYGSQDGFDGPWLVGNKLSYVDLAFVPWQMVAVHCFGGESGRYKEADYPLVTEWLARLKARKTVTDAMQWLSGLKGDGH
ncbi:uncharacterized protein THITE_35553 [Thermothielavioides terrestris NRRL 8126]|uniref:Uncharacterized protein n=1 Tax=Thermothielavioides terrestris (strain ATCC 38088 / NRRL 8126) TaxID=578455 RepID=G2R3E1_THETT|nr:uncharacterized protein THITE_35553 [Thermothielavioides terrestris NRRL 8126]AEO65952.1 hypothetical protein THITE_35553 [Thermothielavioides terrestris NRRL 8126]